MSESFEVQNGNHISKSELREQNLYFLLDVLSEYVTRKRGYPPLPNGIVSYQPILEAELRMLRNDYENVRQLIEAAGGELRYEDSDIITERYDTKNGYHKLHGKAQLRLETIQDIGAGNDPKYFFTYKRKISSEDNYVPITGERSEKGEKIVIARDEHSIGIVGLESMRELFINEYGLLLRGDEIQQKKKDPLFT